MILPEILLAFNLCLSRCKEISPPKYSYDAVRKLKLIGRDIDKSNNQINIGCGYDHPFILNKGKIHLEDKISKRAMDIKTNQECVVVYSMNFTDDLVLYNDKTNQRRFGICFETQAPPIGQNMCFLERSILEKDREYTQITEYKFYITE